MHYELCIMNYKLCIMNCKKRFVLLLTVLLMVNGTWSKMRLSESNQARLNCRVPAFCAKRMVHAQSTSYPYLTFETTDGAKASIPVISEEGVEIAINGNTLTVGNQQFTLTNLAKMYFSTTDETAAGIENVNDNESYTEIYDLQGKKVHVEMVNGKSLNGKLPKGIYIVKTKEKTYKMMVR